MATRLISTFVAWRQLVDEHFGLTTNSFLQPNAGSPSGQCAVGSVHAGLSATVCPLPAIQIGKSHC
jgi:hypothetical protein